MQDRARSQSVQRRLPQVRMLHRAQRQRGCPNLSLHSIHVRASLSACPSGLVWLRADFCVSPLRHAACSLVPVPAPELPCASRCSSRLRGLSAVSTDPSALHDCQAESDGYGSVRRRYTRLAHVCWSATYCVSLGRAGNGAKKQLTQEGILEGTAPLTWNASIPCSC